MENKLLSQVVNREGTELYLWKAHHAVTGIPQYTGSPQQARPCRTQALHAPRPSAPGPRPSALGSPPLGSRPLSSWPLSAVCQFLVFSSTSHRQGGGLALSHHSCSRPPCLPVAFHHLAGSRRTWAPALPGTSLSPGQFAALLTAPPHPRDAHWGLSLPSRDLPASLVQGLGTLASSRRNRAGRAGVPNLVRSSPGLTTRRPSAPVLVSVTPWRRASSQRKEKARPLPCGHRLGNCRTLPSPLLTKADLHSTAKVQELSVNSCAPHRDSRQTPLSTPFAEGTCPGHRA